jgi:hypothetical protein
LLEVKKWAKMGTKKAEGMVIEPLQTNIAAHFGEVKDPRQLG